MPDGSKTQGRHSSSTMLKVTVPGDEVGTAEVGKLPDLVLREADSSTAITNATRITAAVANGRLLERADPCHSEA